MREILFHGKRVDNGEWVEGDVLQTRYHSGHIEYQIMPQTSVSSSYPVLPETVGQYTGLTDRNRKKIFEGDIIICRKEIGGNFIDSCTRIGFVEMKHGAFGLHIKQGYYRPFKDWLEDFEYTIIGNIHDDPELLR